MAHYLELKRMQGFAYKVVSTDDIGDTPMEIKSYIFDHKNCGIEYLLLIGNNSDIPAYSWPFSMSTNGNGWTLSDYWYGCMGDSVSDDKHYNQEIAVGRFCVSNVSELHNMINKHLSYSTPKDSTNNWIKKVLLVAHKQGNEYAGYEYEECLDNTWAKYNAYADFSTQYGTDPTVGNESVVKQINQGVGLLIYRGHGSSTGWRSDWSYDGREFDSIQVNKLNSSINPVVFSIACKNSNIAQSPCLMEHFTTNESAAVAFWGATEDTNSPENNKLSGMISRHIYENKVYRLGDINKLSQFEAVNTSYGLSYFRANAMAYMLGGDPTLGLWTDYSKYFSPTDIEVIQNKDSVTVSVTNIGPCDISLYSIDDLSYFEKADRVNSYTFVGVDVPCYICVNKQNYVPYIFNEDVVISSKVIDNKSALVGKNIAVGETTITNSGTLTIKANNTVTLGGGFSCELGGSLIIE